MGTIAERCIRIREGTKRMLFNAVERIHKDKIDLTDQLTVTGKRNNPQQV
jgi:hypothetical protein